MKKTAFLKKKSHTRLHICEKSSTFANEIIIQQNTIDHEKNSCKCRFLLFARGCGCA